MRQSQSLSLKISSPLQNCHDEKQSLLPFPDQLIRSPKPNSKSLKGIFVMIIGVIAFHGLRFTVKMSLQISNISLWQILLWRNSVMAALNLFVILFFLPKVKIFQIPRQARFLLFLRSLSGIVLFTLGFLSVKLLTYSTGMVMIYIFPLITAVLAWVILKEKLSIYDVICLVVCFIGLFFFYNPQLLGQSIPEQQTLKDTRIGLFVGLMGSLFLAFDYIIIRKMGKQLHFTLPPLYFGTFASIVYLGVILINNSFIRDQLTNYSPKLYLILFLSGFFGWIGQNMLSLALQTQKAARIAAINYLEAIFGFIFQFTVFHGHVGIAQILGSAIICLSTFFLTLMKCLGKIK